MFSLAISRLRVWLSWKINRAIDVELLLEGSFFRTHRFGERELMFWDAISDWRRKRKLRVMLQDPRSAKGFRSIGQLEKGIGADRATTERLLLAVGARKADHSEEWTLAPPKSRTN